MMVFIGVSLSSILFVLFLICLYCSFLMGLMSDVIFIEMDLFGNTLSMISSFLVLLDWMSMLFTSVVSLISSVVLIYSFSYMSQDKNSSKFILIVFMFVISMFLMILSPNMLSILMGWDGLGLVSYCLVIYYQNTKSYSAGMITLLSNRIGDLAILVSICWLMNFGSFNLLLMNSFSLQEELLFCIFLLTLAATTKSAQIPFSAWLPAAMAAPTPVSSLVHSSTLVTAGVYLLIRFSFNSMLMEYLFFLSCLTMIMSGVGSFFEMDLKKVIALSTLSQLGVMMMSLSMGMKDMAFFHLVSHALFKSLLFLCAGFYIHSSVDWQDIRLMSKFNLIYPVFSVYFSVASLALSGFPFMSGFYSKDLVIEYFLMISTNVYFISVVYLATLMTMVYSLRLIYITFFFFSGASNFSLSEEDFIMLTPMTFLFIFSITGGSTMSWIFFPFDFINIGKIFKLMLPLGLLGLFILMFKFNGFPLMVNKKLFFLSYMWDLPFLSSSFLVSYLNKSFYLIKLCDQGWIEFVSGQKIYYNITRLSFFSDYLNLVNIKSMMYFFFISLFIFMVVV